MRILIAFVLSFGVGAASRWTGVPSLAPQAIVGALLIVAMSTGWVTVGTGGIPVAEFLKIPASALF